MSIWSIDQVGVSVTATSGNSPLLRQVLLTVFFLYASLLFGCRDKADQVSEEMNGAAFMARILAFHETQFPGGTVTNLEQVFKDTETPYPTRWHHYFRAFGKHAGFKNSVFEKYLLVPRIQHPAVTGELAMLNATPFPNSLGQFGRVVVSKTGTGLEDWTVNWLPEEEIQKIFRETGRTIPKAVVSKPPVGFAEPEPPPLGSRIESYFIDVAVTLGIGSGAGPIMMRISFALLGVIILLAGWFAWIRSR